MDDHRFDRFTRTLGSKPTRRQSLGLFAGAAVAVALPRRRAAAGIPCGLICPANIEFFDESETCAQSSFFSDPTVPSGCAGGSFTVGCDHLSGESFPLGVTTVTCNSIDPILSCQFTVTGFDANPIIATCPADISMEASGPTSVAFGPVMFGTACSPNTGAANCDFSSGDVFPLGTTTVTCTVPQGAQDTSPGSCSFTITLAPAQVTASPTSTATEAPIDPTATPTEFPATTAPTTVPGEPTATEVPATVAPTSIRGEPSATATAAPVTGLPNTGAGGSGSGGRNLLPIAAVGAGAALLVRRGLRHSPAAPVEESE